MASSIQKALLLATTLTLGACSNPFGGPSISGTFNLVLDEPTGGIFLTGKCYPATASFVSLLSVPVTFSSSGAGEDALFFSDSLCTQPLSSNTPIEVSSSTRIYVLFQAVGSPTISATGMGLSFENTFNTIQPFTQSLGFVSPITTIAQTGGYVFFGSASTAPTYSIDIAGHDYTAIAELGNSVIFAGVALMTGLTSPILGNGNAPVGFGNTQTYAIYDMVPDGNGNLYVGGTYNNYCGTATPGIVRLRTDGSVDTTFQYAGTPTVNSLILDPAGTGNIYENDNTNSLVQQVSSTGAILASFTMPTGAPLDSSALVAAGDGTNTVYASGGAAPPFLARITSAGTVNTSFATFSSGAADAITSLASDSSGNLYVGGTFTQVNGASQTNLVKLDKDGTIVGSFAPAALPPVLALTLSGGRLFVGTTGASTTDLSVLNPSTGAALNSVSLQIASVTAISASIDSLGSYLWVAGNLASCQGQTVAARGSFQVARVNLNTLACE